MITVERLGTFGNNIWEYATARILAEKLGLKLKCASNIDDSIGSAGFTEKSASSSWITGLPNTKPEIDGEVIEEPVVVLPRYHDLNSISKGRIIMNDFYDHYKHIKNHKKQVKEWFKTNIESPIVVNHDDLVLTIRRGWCNSSPTVPINNGGCYPVSMCPPGAFFLKLLKKIDYKRIILCTDSFDDPYFEFLNELDCEVIKADFSGIEQFALINSANKIVITTSTFCWWGAFLSNATEIYCPWIQDLNNSWYVDDEERFIYVTDDLLSEVGSYENASPQSTAPEGAMTL